ncbi:MAG: hypothetical protein HKN21_14550, partial [Candidatus Eisenbacteria bacterium]|nr:hypothetical protein [Candidatus Eisenbacteria bacterium]
RIRARFRDDSGTPNDTSPWSEWIPFRTAPQAQTFPMLLEDMANAAPDWKRQDQGGIQLPYTGAQPGFLRFQGADSLHLEIFGTPGGNDYIDFPALSDHYPLRIVWSGGSQGLTNAPTSRITFDDDDATTRTVYLPPVTIAPNDTLFLWVDDGGNTYYGLSEDTEPNFNFLAQSVWVPWVPEDNEHVIERVVSNLFLPVNIAFHPSPGPDSLDALFYVTELYGKVKVVTNNFTVYTYADSLLNFVPTGDFPGSGEMGVSGIVIEPTTGDLFITSVYDSLGVKYNQVVRLVSSPDGLSSTNRITVLGGIPSFASHQVHNISIGPDEKLYVHVGDAFAGGAVAQDPNDLRGKILRINQDGTSPGDNPFGPTSLVYALGVRNAFGGSWRNSDNTLYATDNGTNVGDRVIKVVPGSNYGYCCNFSQGAIFEFTFTVGPTALIFDELGALGSDYVGHMFVAWSGPTYATGQVFNGKRIWEFALDDTGGVVMDQQLVSYSGIQKGTVVGMAMGPDGLYFTDLYGEEGFDQQGITKANIYRLRRADGTTGVVDEPGLANPYLFTGPPFPNPMRSRGAFRFSIPQDTEVRSWIVDARGRLVRNFGNRSVRAGEHEIVWDGRTDRGRSAAPGVYWLRLETRSGLVDAARIVRLKP